jgi:hydrogenase nickel incorporation protein HypA/HybF
MHELAVTEGLLQIILDQVQGTKVTRVYGVSLVIGDLASIVDESVQFYFDILSKGTVAEGAQLSVTRVAPEYGCRSCGFLSAERSQSYRCQACGAEDIFIGRGQEFYLDSIEVETADG